MAQAPRYWIGDPDPQCDLCRKPFGKVFIDGKTDAGPWGNMCPACHRQHGVGLGLGRGQKYQRQADGRWLKVGG